jgi:flagellar basal-body rod protein FlgC
MNVSRVKTAGDIAITGLQAESKKLNVIAANIANAGTTRTEAGGPYRRKNVVLSTQGDGLSGVNVQDVVGDMQTQFQSVYSPGNPDADAAGYVQMPNVELPMEMMQMVSASRAYQANVAVLKKHTDMMDATLELLR